MHGLSGIDAANKLAEERELAELRADTVKGLRHAFATGGVEAVIILLGEAGVLVALGKANQVY